MSPVTPDTPAATAGQLPLRAIESDFIPVLRAALAQRERVEQFVTEALATGIDSVVFVGTGGSLASSVHAVETLKGRVTTLFIDNIPSAEVVHRMPARIGSRTLVIASSHSGGTPETVEATRLIAQTGATIITLSSVTDTPLGRLGHLALGYGSDRTITSAKQILLSHITWAVLGAVGADDDREQVLAAFAALPEALLATLDESEDRLRSIAADITGRPYTYVLASGPNQGAGYLLAMCYLIEMQWMRAGFFNAGEFFHGAFELATEDSAAIVFIGEDASRAIAERAERFVRRYTPHAHSLDTRTLTLPGVPQAARAEVTPIALGVLASRLADHLEAASGHSLDERRYMYKVEY